MNSSPTSTPAHQFCRHCPAIKSSRSPQAGLRRVAKLAGLAVLTIGLPGSGGAIAQGTTQFYNSSTTLITDQTGLAVPVGTVTVGLYYAVAGTTDPSTLVLLKVTGIAPFAGRYTGGTAITPFTTPGGTTAVFEVRAWTGSYPSYEAAVASGDPLVGLGRSGLITRLTGHPASNPPLPPLALNAPGFSISIPQIPEPSTIALCLSGLGMLVCRQRRKSDKGGILNVQLLVKHRSICCRSRRPADPSQTGEAKRWLGSLGCA